MDYHHQLIYDSLGSSNFSTTPVTTIRKEPVLNPSATAIVEKPPTLNVQGGAGAAKVEQAQPSHKAHDDKKRNKKIQRKAAGSQWQDPTLEEWPENDYRIFCGDLGNEVNDEVLANAFKKYPSFVKARVVRDKRTLKSKGFGFVSLMSQDDYIKAMREMQGKYVGNRPIRLKKSDWQDKSAKPQNKKPGKF